LADPSVLEGYIKDRIQLLESSKERFIEQLGAGLYEEQLVKMQEQTTAFIVAVDDFWKKMVIGKKW